MSKKLISLLLAAITAVAVYLPLTVTANAANDVYVKFLEHTANDRTVMETFTPEDFPKLGKTYNNTVSATLEDANRRLWLYLNGFAKQSAAEINAYYGIYIRVPKGWSVMVRISGENTLSVQNMSFESTLNGPSAALATNGDLQIYAYGEDATLNIRGEMGRDWKYASPEQDFYGIVANDIDVNSLGAAFGNRLSMNFIYKTYLSDATDKKIYPFKVTGTNKTAELCDVDYSYTHSSNYMHSSPEDTPIVLSKQTVFNTDYTTGHAVKDYAYHTVRYDDSFTGIVDFKGENAFFFGGAYSSEINVELLGQRHFTRIGNTAYYHAISKNCDMTLSHIEAAALKSDFSFLLSYGDTLPGSVEGDGYIAGVVWTKGDDPADVTGAAADYGIRYKATVTVIPRGKYFISGKKALQTQMGNNSLVPTTAYSGGFTENPPYEPSLYFRYNEIEKQALKITKQPVDYYGSAGNRIASFSIEANYPNASYQWQISDNSSSGWQNLENRDDGAGEAMIGGAKDKNLTYNFGYMALAANLKYFRCTVSNGTQTVISNAVKYEFKSAEQTKIHRLNMSYTVPVTGRKLSLPSYKSWVGNDFNVTETWEKMSIKIAGGSLKESWSAVASGTQFTDGVYRVIFVLTPKAGRFIADDFEISMENSFRPVNGYDTEIQSDKITIEAHYNVKATISELTLGGSWAPKANAGVNANVPYPAAYDEAGNIISFYGDITQKVVIDQSKCFWYEGTSAADPKPLSLTESFKAGRYYTYRFNVKPYSMNDTKYTFDPEIKFLHRDAPYDATVTAAKLSDGSYNVDFTFSRLASTVASIRLKSVNPPYGMKSYQYEARSDDPAYTVTDRTGWHTESFGTAYVGTPQVGRRYYTTLTLTAAKDVRFTSDLDALTLSAVMSDGSPAPYMSVEYKLESRARENDTLIVSLGFDCARAIHYSTRIDGFSSPKANKALDRSFETDDAGFALAFVDYEINGEKVADYDKEKPKPGDIVHVYIGYTSSDGIGFDANAKLYWFLDGETDYSFYTTRSYNYVNDSDVCVFDRVFVIPTAWTEISTFLLEMAPPAAWEPIDDGRFLAYGLEESEVYVFVDGEYVSNYDYTPIEGQTIEIRCVVLPQSDYTVSDAAVAVWKVNGKTVTGKRIDDQELPSGYATFVFTYTVPGTFLPGDVDDDGKITAADARLALRRAVDLETYPEGSREFIACDVDKDGKVTAGDARIILRVAVDLETLT